MANGNLNSRTRPHLEENLAKSLKDQSKFNRAQATKLSCRSLNNHWLQASAASDSARPWPAPSDPLIVTDTMLPSCFSQGFCSHRASTHSRLWLLMPATISRSLFIHLMVPSWCSPLHRQLLVIHLMFTLPSGKQLYSSVHHCQR